MPPARLDQTLALPSGAHMSNRFMLAPMTNRQSHDDGTLSEEEYHWLTLRAKGGFGATMTCAANVQANGQGWPGELGAYDDRHIPGLRRLAEGIRAFGSLSLVQLFHGGVRAPRELIGGEDPVAPSFHEETGARALETEEVEALREAFIDSAVRCQKAGFEGVELHGAHGYILCQFLSPEYNRREDQYGGNAENRARLIWEILKGIRSRCGDQFTLGIRLSPEGLGLRFEEMLDLTKALIEAKQVDFLDISLWDCAAFPQDEAHKHKRLIDWYAEIPRSDIPLGVAGKLLSSPSILQAMNAGVDFVLIGRGGILHHDFPRKVIADPNFTSRDLPVSREVLQQEGLSEKFIDYMARWDGFVAKS